MKLHATRLPLLAAVGALLAAPLAWAATVPASATYVAELHSLNTQVAGTPTTGTAWFTFSGAKTGEALTITVDVHGAPPDMVHWQHIHGFTNDHTAACATAANAGPDDIVDITNTGGVSGTTMIPLDTNPVGMDVPHGDYPKANASGDYHYQETVQLSALKAAFRKHFPGDHLDLARRVIYIHGVPADTKLPDTVKSLGTIPAQVTLPIACGVIERVNGR